MRREDGEAVLLSIRMSIAFFDILFLSVPLRILYIEDNEEYNTALSDFHQQRWSFKFRVLKIKVQQTHLFSKLGGLQSSFKGHPNASTDGQKKVCLTSDMIETET